jgi:hypothetical protein
MTSRDRDRMRNWRSRGPLAALALAVAVAAPTVARAEAAPGKAATAAVDVDEAQLTPAQKAAKAARKEARERLRNEVLDQMRAMRMWKLTETLKLDQATAAKVFPLLAQYDERSKQIGAERVEIAKEVHREVRSGKPDEAKLRVAIDRLLANQAKRHALDDERFKALRTALTPLQQAQLLLLLPRIEDDFRHRVREAMDAQRRAERGTATDMGPPPPRPR